jgi:hypothetical protein
MTRWAPLIRLAGWAAILIPAIEVIARQLTRTRPIAFLPESPLLLAAIPLAGLGLVWRTAAAIPEARVESGGGAPRGSSRRSRLLLAALLASGLALQLQLGARLQSDGFYYFAYLRSLAFDRDVNFLNDYRLLGLTDKPYLFEPTATGHAPSAWTIGPAITWAPFFAAGHAAARSLQSQGLPVATDGTSYPYRQAICIAGLFYALLGAWMASCFAARYFERRSAAVAAAATIGGSFMLWYALAEPTMTHAPSMAASAGFAWLWSATFGRRTMPGWIALGALAGFAGLIRWQNVLFALLPAIELLAIAVRAARRRDLAAVRAQIAGGAVFTAAATLAFVPQMLAWKAIYGSYLAVSPLGPQIHWLHPQLADILFSSRNGLLAMSPVLYVAAIGLVAFAARRPAVGLPMLAATAAMTYFNASIHDWWGSASYGGRRFDGIIPLLVPGLAGAFEAARALIARRPQLVAAAVAGMLIVWQITFVRATGGLARSDQPSPAISFREIGASQARVLHQWIGHPFTYPASLWFAVRNGMSPASYDILRAARFLGDPARPYGRIDVGVSDEVFVLAGWHSPERGGDVSFRRIDREAVIAVPLDHRAALDVQIRARAANGTPAPAALTIEIGGRRFGPVDLEADWAVASVATPADVWRAGVNRLTLAARTPGVAVDYVRVMKPAP